MALRKKLQARSKLSWLICEEFFFQESYLKFYSALHLKVRNFILCVKMKKFWRWMVVLDAPECMPLMPLNLYT